MSDRHLYKPFEVHQLTIDNRAGLPYVYYFFEIAHVLEGSGIR
ncbi:hypothetical protein [Chitinophaga nivalis]|uniref:Uncharacterized protein n=1 Tax=Chitinophaga nivalis TaxID=2991709 RepID=A0ABT3INC7_9BACT|nr:hypothetical protein [Chitinophaga nivalis]MCW3464849.1 hypothetical protein [Chitinophaga nivalis]MCW3485460.1 hypothetical protein [Chitinophaga nivalis]